MSSMKIALTSKDGQVTGKHFGRTPYFVVVTIDQGQVVNRELRANTFTNHMNSPHEKHQHGAGGHSCGPRIAEGLGDCQVLICGGIGRGAIHHLQSAGIKVISTTYDSIEDSIQGFINGELNQNAEACKDHKH